MGVLEGCDRETKSGGEGPSQVGDVVEEWSNERSLGPAATERVLTIDSGGEANLGEDVLDGGVVEEGVGLHTDGEDG